jgi:dTMP kinase
MLITIEGVDGVGKTTLVNLLKKKIAEEHSLNEKVLFTREPYASRAMIDVEDPWEKLFLFMADHCKHMNEVILPNHGTKIIVCDRYIDSRVAYQSVDILRACEYDLPYNIQYYLYEEIHKSSMFPDKTFLLTAEEGTIISRLLYRGGGDAGVLYEKDTTKLIEIQEMYLDEAIGNDRFVIIETDNKTPEEITAQIFEYIMENKHWIE